MELANLEQTADLLRAEASCTSLPIDVLGIAQFLGLDVRYAALGQLCGFIWQGPQSVIVLNGFHRRYPGRLRFTAAHEIGHALDTPTGVLLSCDPYARNERLMNRFAAALLMPAVDLAREYADWEDERWGVKPNFNALCRRFGVSRSSMAHRLTELRTCEDVVTQ